MFGLVRDRKYQGNINYLKERISRLEKEVENIKKYGTNTSYSVTIDDDESTTRIVP